MHLGGMRQYNVRARHCTTTQEEAEVAQAATIRELKKKRQKQLLNNAELDLILQDLHKELQQLNVKKKESISNAANHMSAVIPKEMISKELVQGLGQLRFKIDRSYIYHILTEKWPEVYNSSVSSNIRQIDEGKDTEDSRERLIQKGTVTKEEIARHLEDPATMDFYRDWYHDSEIELDGGIIDEIKIATRDYPDKVIIRQRKGKAVEIIKVITDKECPR